MMESERDKGTIAENLTPTFKNVIRDFITTTMRDILLNEKKVNFNIIFRQPEAISLIERVLEEYIAEYHSGFRDDAIKIVHALKQGNERNNDLPS